MDCLDGRAGDDFRPASLKYRAVVRLLGPLLLAAVLPAAQAGGDPFIGIDAPGHAAIGPVMGLSGSPYRGAGLRHDFLPTYLYEGEHAYLHSLSAGLKFGDAPALPRFDVFLRRRLEGFDYKSVDAVPASLAGMARREPGTDAGASVRIRGAWGTGFAELLHDVSNASHGSELRIGYQYPWRRGRLWIRPQAVLGVRDKQLNDYYFGVRPAEANAKRAAYSPGAGVAPELGLYATYDLTRRWRAIAGLTVSRLPASAADSPIVGNATEGRISLGLLYDVSPEHRKTWEEGEPLILRAYNGDSTDCHDLLIMELRCTSTHTRDRTGVAGFELGRRFIERLNGWPVDIAGFLGIQRHREEGFQPDFWSVRAYFKGYFYGFPWDDRVRTRIGMGVGLSYAERIPLMEVRDLEERGRNTSKLLNTFDPTVDVNVGDIFAIKRLRETYVGLGVSHRSGIFGTSELLGNVDGGSNYIYAYVETSI